MTNAADGPIIRHPTEVEADIEEPTAQLRWNSGILEQKWIIRRVNLRSTLSAREEWRPIPSGAWR